MDSLQSLDIALFRWVNVDLKNSLFDRVLPFFSSNALFVPALIILAACLVWKGGTRGRLLVFFLLLTFVIGDPLIVSSLKHWIDRPRPFVSLSGINLIVGRVESGSMPSGHAANWFAATMVSFIYYRSSLWFMLPMAVLEAFSRVYLGAHYPSDVLAGTLLGLSYAILIMWVADAIWQLAGRRMFPIWWNVLPSLFKPEGNAATSMAGGSALATVQGCAKQPGVLPTEDQHWQRLAYLLIGAMLAGHLIYLACDRIELSEDEAYQWLWSKHLALSYFSKPPLIAYIQWVGTHLWGDTEFGVRFFAPVFGAVASILLVRFLGKTANGFVACMSVLAATAIPLLMVGATLFTIDSPSVLFWTAAMVSGWAAVQRNSTPAWLWTGLWIALGFLSKYVALYQLLCWAVFFVFWPAARSQLRRPGPYLALLMTGLSLVPVVIWNAQHHWITLTHLAHRGGLKSDWHPTLKFLRDFLGSEIGLLNPIFFFGMIWAVIRAWRRRSRDALEVYLVSMGLPLFLFYLCYTLRARVQPNWIAPSVLPLLCLMLIEWDRERRNGSRKVQHWLMAGIALGWLVVVPLHDPKLLSKMIGRPLPIELNFHTRVLGWKETAHTVEQARKELLAEGNPVFVIGDHYGIASLLSFYMPEAKAGVPDQPLVYYPTSEEPKNQFYFWPGYQSRKGQSALYVVTIDRQAVTPPPSLQREFASVTDLGIRDVLFKNRVYQRIQLFACRDLR